MPTTEILPSKDLIDKLVFFQNAFADDEDVLRVFIGSNEWVKASATYAKIKAGGKPVFTKGESLTIILALQDGSFVSVRSFVEVGKLKGLIEEASDLHYMQGLGGKEAS